MSGRSKNHTLKGGTSQYSLCMGVAPPTPQPPSRRCRLSATPASSFRISSILMFVQSIKVEHSRMMSYPQHVWGSAYTPANQRDQNTDRAKISQLSSALVSLHHRSKFLSYCPLQGGCRFVQNQ